MSKEQYSIMIEPLTGVHIGTGEDITPLDYKLHEISTASGKKKLYIKFLSDAILKGIIESGDTKKLKEFEKLSESGDMKAIQNFFHDNCVPERDIDYPCDVTKEFIQQYNRNRDKNPNDAASIVLQMYRPKGAKTPVIPGSSIKGAIRTAVLNNLLDILEDNKPEKYDTLYSDLKKSSYKHKFDLEKKLLNHRDAKEDPFRSIGILDCSFAAKGTQLVGCMKNISCKGDELTCDGRDNMLIQAEVLRGKLMDATVSSKTKITVNSDLYTSGGITQEISIQKIIDSCNSFFWSEFDNEYNFFYKETISTEADSMIKLLKMLKEIKETENQFILRVGRWSQVEFVTFNEDFRYPKTPMNKGKQNDWGSTRTVFNYDGQYLPLGWCKCTVNKL